MITREELRQLAEIESPEACAISFYFQPTTPQNKSHREEIILIKDLVRNALRQAEHNQRSQVCRNDLEKLLDVAEHLHGNHARAKAIFSCGAKGVWREFDLPALLPGSAVVVNRRFHLKPLTSTFEGAARSCVVLVDRERARLFDYWLGDIREVENFFDQLPPHGRSDGFAGYDAGHKERNLGHEAMHHFKRVAERLKEKANWDEFQWLIIGCRDETWPELQPHLHPYVQKRLIGRFTIDPAVTTPDQVRTHAEGVVLAHKEAERQALVREVIGEAERDGRGAMGLRSVLNALERGEVQALLLGGQFAVRGVRCPNCGHMETRTTRSCAVCGHNTEEVHDMSDVLISEAVRRGVDVVHIPHDPEFDRRGNVGALLRFRADQNTSAKMVG